LVVDRLSADDLDAIAFAAEAILAVLETEADMYLPVGLARLGQRSSTTRRGIRIRVGLEWSPAARRRTIMDA
jgi:hypothetical protein